MPRTCAVRAASPVPPEMDEVDEVRKIVNRVAEILDNEGITVHVFHDNTSTSSSQNLSTINAWHNSQNRVLDVSVHLNATEGAYGTEVLYVTQEALAREVSAAIAKAGGFKDRGPKYRSDLSFLNGTNKPAILLECWFCDSADDCNRARAHWEAICQAIASSIAGISASPGPTPPPETGEPLPPKFPPDVISRISEIAASSTIASYSWRDRGVAPPGYTKGMAIAYAQAVQRFNAGDPVMLEMAKANTHDDSVDAICWYNSNYVGLGMSNAVAGVSIPSATFMFYCWAWACVRVQGKHCEGRDTSASNTSSDTAEAGLFQTSWNAHTCSKQLRHARRAVRPTERAGLHERLRGGRHVLKLKLGLLWVRCRLHLPGDVQVVAGLCRGNLRDRVAEPAPALRADQPQGGRTAQRGGYDAQGGRGLRADAATMEPGGRSDAARAA